MKNVTLNKRFYEAGRFGRPSFGRFVELVDGFKARNLDDGFLFEAVMSYSLGALSQELPGYFSAEFSEDMDRYEKTDMLVRTDPRSLGTRLQFKWNWREERLPLSAEYHMEHYHVVLCCLEGGDDELEFFRFVLFSLQFPAEQVDDIIDNYGAVDLFCELVDWLRR